MTKTSTSPASKGQPKKRQRTKSSSPNRKKKATTSAVSDPLIGATKDAPPSSILIIDNGGDTLKYGWATDENPKLLPNVTARLIYQINTLVGDELNKVQNPNSLIGITRSTERGMIVNLGNQTQVWKRLLDLMGVIIPANSEAANSFGWKVTSRNKKVEAPPKTVSAHSIAVVLLLPPNCPRILLDQILYVWMEDFGVSSVGLGISSVCAAKEHPNWRTSCTVDLGWSSSLIVPTFKQKLIDASAIRRLPIGGRHLINMLKYYMSYRQYNLMDQETILRDVLEQLAYVSLDLKEELRLARYSPSGRRPYDRDYVLPDYQTSHKGTVRIPLALQKLMEQEEKTDGDSDNDEDDDDDDDFNDEDAKSKGGDGSEDGGEGEGGDQDEEDDDDEEEETDEQKRKRLLQQRDAEQRRRKEQEEDQQMLRVSVERFTVPEVLFRPVDARLQADLVGLAEAIVQAVKACPTPYHSALYQSIRITGGLSQLQNLQTRLEQELRAIVPSEYKLCVELAESPIDQAWFGAKNWVQQTPHSIWSVSRDEWEGVGKRKAYTQLLISNGGFYA